jgi:peptidoglycan-associated lipoprotein
MHVSAVLAIGATLLSLVACSTPPAPAAASAPTSGSSAASAVRAPSTGASAAAVTASAARSAPLPPHLDPGSRIATERSVYFDYDEYTIRTEYVGMIERHGRYLTADPALRIRIEGNSDERGSSEYNLALGQKRAQAVANALRLFGVRDAQVEAVSWGKERPRNPGQDEAAWAENRRADIVYLRP